MKITVSSSAFCEQLQIASRVLQKKTPMPILECFLIEVKDNEMRITASNSSDSLITHVQLIELQGEGCLCINAEKLLSTIKEIPEQPLLLEYNENTFELKCKHSCGEFNIVGDDAKVFPKPMPVVEGMKITSSSKELLSGVATCYVATDEDEVMPFKKGIYFDIKQDKPLVIVATEGRKLVKKTLQDVKPGIEGGFILPKTIASILKSVIKKDVTAEIAYDAHRATIGIGNAIIYFRLVETKYPNYNSVIPTKRPIVVSADRLALIGALKRVGVFCNKSNNFVKLELKANLVTFTGNDVNNATSAEEYVPCEYDGVPFSAGFAYTNFVEILNIIETDTVCLEFVAPERPCIVSPKGSNDDLLMLLMPMKID